MEVHDDTGAKSEARQTIGGLRPEESPREKQVDGSLRRPGPSHLPRDAGVSARCGSRSCSGRRGVTEMGESP